MSNETPLSPEAEKLAAARKRNLDLASPKSRKDFGENAIMLPWRSTSKWKWTSFPRATF